jgi:hypothetical protein
MSGAEILFLAQLFSALEPAVVGLVTTTINAFSSSDLTADERMKLLTDLQTTLKPMVAKA